MIKCETFNGFCEKKKVGNGVEVEGSLESKPGFLKYEIRYCNNGLTVGATVISGALRSSLLEVRAESHSS